MVRGREPGSVREKEMLARSRAFAGARLAMYEGVSVRDAGARMGVNRSSVQEAILVLQHGTPEEAHAVEFGGTSLRKMRDIIGKRLPPGNRRSEARKAVMSVETVDVRKFEAGVWEKMREALDALNSMPVATDVVAIVKKNAMRDDAVSRKLLTAHNWLEEFINAYTV